MRSLRFGSTVLVAAALLSCGGDDLVLPSEGEPAAINILQGNDQSGRVGEALADSLVVEVLDGTDMPVPGATVVVELGAGSAQPDTLTTNAEGLGSAQITLGDQVGETAGTARVIAPETPVVVQATFTVTAVASDAHGLAAVSGDAQTGAVGTALADPLVVQVTDHLGNPIEGITITWTAEGGGSVSAPSTVTDAEGFASVTRTLGPAAGPQTTLASNDLLAGSPVVFNHTATAGSASGVLIVSGDGQIATPGATLPLPLVVQVVDEASNPVVGAAVTWVVTAGGGTIDPATGPTDANGQASTTWTLGSTAGANTVQAIVSGVGQAQFTATAAAGTPSVIRIVSGNGQSGAAGTALDAQLVVQVLDDADNPVTGATVNWSIESGGGAISPGSAQTDAQGRAAAAWTLGPATGTQRARASVSGAGTARFEATATAGAAAVLGIRRQPSLEVVAGVPFNRQPEIQIRDASGNPVQTPGVTITAAIASGPGQLGGTRTATTGPNGRAAFDNLEITGAVGAHTLIFAAPGLQSVTSTSFTVGPANTTTRITSDTPDPSAPGEAVTVTFEVTSPGGTPPGTVEVTAAGGSESCSASVSAGQCQLTLTAEGNRALTATYQGSTTFLSSSGNTSHNVVTPDRPPTAQNDNYSVTRGVPLSVDAADGVLANDSDPDGDNMTASLISGPANGTLDFNSDGSFVYTSSPTFFGSVTFTYQVSAGGQTDTATVTIIVT
jgi:hypothetical protein